MAKKKKTNAHFVVFLSCRCQNVENVHETFINSKILFENEHSECTSSVFRYLAALVGKKQAKRSEPPVRKQGWIPRKTISKRKAFVCPQKGNWAFFWTFSFHLCLLSAYFQSWNAKLLSWKPPHHDRAPAILLIDDIYKGVKSFSSLTR